MGPLFHNSKSIQLWWWPSLERTSSKI